MSVSPGEYPDFLTDLGGHVVRRTRTTLLAIALLAALALPGCGYRGGGGDGYGDPAAAAPPAAAPSPSSTADALPAKEADKKADAAGIPTSKLVAATIPKMGKVVTDAKGWVLYRFDLDKAKPSATTCSGKCAQVWPPVLTDGTPELEGIPAKLVGTVKRDDGGIQVTLNGWPLYRYIGDPKPGAWKGQMVNGTWFVTAPDGKKNLTCVPTATPKPVQPPADDSGGDGY
jgi:predicted lipoprotein with Yx(FWY)xxD motif